MQPVNVARLRRIVTLIALALALIHLVLPDLAIDHVTLILLGFALIPWLTPLVKSLEAPGGWKIELREELKREIEVAATGALHRLAALDVRLIAYWEREKFLKSDESSERLALIAETVSTLETEFAKAGHLERLGIGLALRLVYWEYLNRAREHYASGKPYHEIKNRVLAGLQLMKKNNGTPSSNGAAEQVV